MIRLLRYGVFALTALLWAEALHAEDARPNILLVSIDTLRADHMSPYGYERNTTPEIGAFAAQAHVFEDCTAPIPITLPAHVSMLTGLHPEEHGVRVNGVDVPEALQTLPEILGPAGYDTFGYVTTPMLTTAFRFNQGFDPFHQYTHGEEADRSAAPADEFARWIKARAPGRPFFAFIHYLDPHSPYGGVGQFAFHFMEKQPDETGPFFIEQYAPPLIAEWIHQGQYTSDPGLRRFIARYDEGILSADFQVGRLLQILRDSALLENTLVIITSDHGEGLGDGKNDFNHGESVYQNTVHVPLIIAPPGRAAGSRHGAPAVLMDIAPTVLDYAGAAPPVPMPGARSLRPLIENPGVEHFAPRTRYCASQASRGRNFRRAVITPEGMKFIHDEWNNGRDIWTLPLSVPLNEASHIGLKVRCDHAIEMRAVLKTPGREVRVPVRLDGEEEDQGRLIGQWGPGIWRQYSAPPLDTVLSKAERAGATLDALEINTARSTNFDALFDQIGIRRADRWVLVEDFESADAPVWRQAQIEHPNRVQDAQVLANGRTDQHAEYGTHASMLRLRYDVHPHAWQLYDLREDPRETRNLYEEKPELVEKLRRELDEYYGESHTEQQSKPDKDAEDALRSLGYL